MNSNITITFLGTGTSQGVPMIGCPCDVCQSTDPKDKRLRTAIWVRSAKTSIVIDTGPDFRCQALRANIDRVDAVIFTHGHKDHVAGLDDIRAYNYWQRSAIDIYATTPTWDVLKREFQYVFADFKYPGIPELNVHVLDGAPFTIGDLHIIPIKVMHYKMEVYGFRIGDFTYITDANYIAPEELEKVFGSKVFVVNALRHEPHISHFTLQEALEITAIVNPNQAYFTHISHQLGKYNEINILLPPHVSLAYDGLKIEI